MKYEVTKTTLGEMLGDEKHIKKEEIIKPILEEILGKYVLETSGKRTNQVPNIKNLFERLEELFSGSSVVKEYPNIRVKSSIGVGNIAKIPWTAFLDRRETDSTQKGVFVCFLFCEDMSGFYLTLLCGVADFIEKFGEQQMPSHVKKLREQFAKLLKGFDLDSWIDLHTDGKLGKQYEKATVAHKFYKDGKMPDDESILSDLNAILQAYEQYLALKR